MNAAVKTRLPKLEAWVESEPNSKGEMGMFCPFHDDEKRSASLNVNTGAFYCHACERGMGVVELVRALPKVSPNGHKPKRKAGALGGQQGPGLTEGTVAGYVSGLMSNPEVLKEFQKKRGLHRDTMEEFQIGWDRGAKAYTIPVRDQRGKLLNIRRYQLDPPEGRRKIWSIAGCGGAVLYPAERLKLLQEFVIICEGELDALLTIQHGFPAITRTGAARVWEEPWNKWFKNKDVYLCHDMDVTGQSGNANAARMLKGVARNIFVMQLPYEITQKHGKDLTDYWLDKHSNADFQDLLDGAEKFGRSGKPHELDLATTGVLGTFDAKNVGQHLSSKVTITGKRSPSYLVPKEATYTCSRKAGAKCAFCPMNTKYHGVHSRTIPPDEEVLLEMVGSTAGQLHELLRQFIGAMKCNLLNIDVTKHRAVEELYVRPSIDKYRPDSAPGDYVNRKIFSVDRHDTMPNNTVEIVGTVYPSPRTQANEFLAWQVNATETSVDKFDLDTEAVELMEPFQIAPGEEPLVKLRAIQQDLAAHVTKIYERPEMHMLMDLTMHSVLSFNFGDQYVHRGWLDTLVVGDTRTGKSEAAQRLLAHYGNGEYISCESASFAGVVGGLQQYGGKEWSVTWGAIPINDRRLVVLDEISGLTTEQISQMSSIRSSGEAQLTKIQSERTYARTRLLWLGNPRGGRPLADYTYGIRALRPLIGNNEDIARFDLAMTVASGDVPDSSINKLRTHHPDKQLYTEEMCQTLLHWVWSRRAEDVTWAPGAEKLAYARATELGRQYVEQPPLIQAANVRIKIARIAVALAARLFSTDATHQKVVVRKAHVEAAVDFINLLYCMPGFGYGEVSSEEAHDRTVAIDMRDEVKSELSQYKDLVYFLRTLPEGKFRPIDIKEMTSMSMELIGNIMGNLLKARMILRVGQEIHLSPYLHEILRSLP